MKKYLLTNSFIVLLLLLVSCEGIFVPDPIDPRLPKYTETGNNVAGAIVDGKTWRSVVESTILNPAINRPHIFYNIAKDSLVLTFYGEIATIENVAIEFSFTGLGFDSIPNLMLLSNRKIELDGNKAKGCCRSSSVPASTDAGTGQIYFTNVKMLDPITFLLTGTFGFLIANPLNKYSEISYGRFDYMLDQSSFVVE